MKKQFDSPSGGIAAEKCECCAHGRIKNECNAPTPPQQMCKYNYIDAEKAKKDKAKSYFKRDRNQHIIPGRNS